MKNGVFFDWKKMTKLPARNLLDGTKDPDTTTGEFRLAMGNLRQYLCELFGEESTDKETARQTLGIDLTELDQRISEKADKQSIETALSGKANVTELSGVAFTGNYNDLIDIPSAIPAGFIGMWSGSAIPAGWALCDGRNGTPDLRDKFVVGAGGTYALGVKGGATSTTLSGNTGETTLTIDQIPAHSHFIAAAASAVNSDGNKSQYYAGTGTAKSSSSAGGNRSHAHSISGSVSIMPPYFALCFIIKL